MQKRLVNFTLKISLFIALYLVATQSGMAQCAMCKAVAEDAASQGTYGIWSGLNMGIIFLMGIPYVLLTVVILVFFRKQVKGFVQSFNNIHS